MNSTFIVNTPKSSMHALAFQGVSVCECFYQIRELVRSRLGDGHALLFAEPAPNPEDNSIDWYSPVQGRVQALTDLPDEAQRTARTGMARLAEDILNLATDLKNTGDTPRVTRGHILEAALRYPDERSLYVVGGQPVFTCWGFGPGNPGAQPQDLTRLAAAVPPAPPPPPEPEPEPRPHPAPPPATPPSRRASLCWWLLPLLLLLLLLLLLTTSFGTWPPLVQQPWFSLQGPALPVMGDATARRELERLQREGKSLGDDLRALEEQVRQRAAQCVPSASVPPAPVPGPPSSPAPNAQDLDDAVLHKDPRALEGIWRCETGLVNTRDNTPVVVEYQFDKTGRGRIRILERGKGICGGGAAASFLADGTLFINTDPQLACETGNPFSGQEIYCRNIDGRTLCIGRNKGETRPWGGGQGMPFFRVR